MNKEIHRCYVCNVPLGESSNVLFVEGQWVHYTCAFQKSIIKSNEIKDKENYNDNNINISK